MQKKRKFVFSFTDGKQKTLWGVRSAVDLGGDWRFCWNGQKTSKLFNLLTEIFSHIFCVCVFGTLTYFIFVDLNSLAGKQWLDVHTSVHSSTIHKNHYSESFGQTLVKLTHSITHNTSESSPRLCSSQDHMSFYGHFTLIICTFSNFTKFSLLMYQTSATSNHLAKLITS